MPDTLFLQTLPIALGRFDPASKPTGLVIVDEVHGFCTVGCGPLAPACPNAQVDRMVTETVGLARRFEAEVGMSLRSWRRRLRLFKAIELLGGGLDVTRTAMDLGYGSTSAFVYAFRTEMGRSPQAYMRGRGGDRFG